MCQFNADGYRGDSSDELRWEDTSRMLGEPIPRPLSELRREIGDGASASGSVMQSARVHSGEITDEKRKLLGQLESLGL